MCDISREENKAINTQLAMKNIPLNSDVLSVIKSFLFHDKALYAKQKIEQKHRKDNIIQTINSERGYELTEYIDEGHGHWAIWLPISTIDGWDNIQMQGSNCLKCGKYVQVSTDVLENAVINNKYIMCVNSEH